MADFFTSVGCMDGRTQQTVADYGKKEFAADFPDTITEAGFIGVLAKRAEDEEFIRDLSNKISISVSNHGSKGIVVHAHEDCAGNPVSNEQQKKEVEQAAMLVDSIIMDTPVVGVFLNKTGDSWFVEEIISLL
ncbi:MAG TPA: carbonic anhydrase [Patescibacteria group bacterium]|nr:carbonic anhydrase [Patescibacteria group bacterium]